MKIIYPNYQSVMGSNVGLLSIISAARSAIMIVGALMLPFNIIGKMEASTTRNDLTPITEVFGSTTAFISVPILQVHEG